MQALILAAGMGRRLGEKTRNNTKCMVEVNGVKLIDRVLCQLKSQNVDRVVIVAGYTNEMKKSPMMPKAICAHRFAVRILLMCF